MRRDCRERFLRHRLQRKPLVSDTGLHHGTRVTHVPWCMSGPLTRGGWKNIPVIPGACATRSFTYLARGPCSLWSRFHGQCHMMPWLYLFSLLPACVITWLCTDSPLQDCYVVLMITSNHPTHLNTGTITVTESSCTHSFPHNDPMHGLRDECVQYYSPPQSCARV